MAIKEKDVKILWSRAAGRCSFPDCNRKLSEDKQSASESFPLGEQAHIVAEEDSGPRGQSNLTLEERNSYSNLVLMCPTHHTLVDKNPEDYPVERLHLIKSQHEIRIERTTATAQDAKRTAADAIYTTLIDSAVELCDLENWHSWSYVATAPCMALGDQMIDQIRDFRLKMLKAVWPGTFVEVERSMVNLSAALMGMAEHFLLHAEINDAGTKWREDRFYKRGGSWNPNYVRDLADYRKWAGQHVSNVVEATKAANWFADAVRRHINPMFFATEGHFTATVGDGKMGEITAVFEYTIEERRNMPAANRVVAAE
ncbi:MAG: HNH endonuclease [Tepidisphaeraceae bacterium]|jgi:hypothetical protein